MHCSRKGEAEELLEKLYYIAPDNSISKAEIGAELLNQRFWNMELKEIIGDSFMIQKTAEDLMQYNKDNLDVLKILRKSQSTCVNRRMVTYLLTDKTEEAKYEYSNFIKIAHGFYTSDELKSNLATKLMDYARGVSYYNPKLSLHLMESALRYFMLDEQHHFRRILLCKIDIEVLHSIVFGEFNSQIFIDTQKELFDSQFFSEYFKAVLKYFACKLIDESNFLKSLNLFDINSSKTSTCKEALKAISNSIFASDIKPLGREKYLMESLMAYIYSILEDYENAQLCLDNISKFISAAGETYKIPLNHNIKNIRIVQGISWSTSDIQKSPEDYLLDCRFW